MPQTAAVEENTNSRTPAAWQLASKARVAQVLLPVVLERVGDRLRHDVIARRSA